MKESAYSELVARRKECRICEGLQNPANGDLARFDSDEIGPWTRLHGDMDAEIMVVGQDWGDTNYYNKHCGLDDLRNPTMVALEKLLCKAGFELSLQSYDHGSRGLFLTNAILCLKSGGLQAAVNPTWFHNCGKLFLRAQVEIVSPRVVVALGERAYKAIAQTFEFRPRPFRQAVELKEGIKLSCGSQLFAVYHCGPRIQNTLRKFDVQISDWVRIRNWLNGLL